MPLLLDRNADELLHLCLHLCNQSILCNGHTTCYTTAQHPLHVEVRGYCAVHTGKLQVTIASGFAVKPLAAFRARQGTIGDNAYASKGAIPGLSGVAAPDFFFSG